MSHYDNDDESSHSSIHSRSPDLRLLLGATELRNGKSFRSATRSQTTSATVLRCRRIIRVFMILFSSCLCLTGELCCGECFCANRLLHGWSKELRVSLNSAESPIFRLIKFPKILLENEARELNNSEGWKGLEIVNYEIIRVDDYLLASENWFKLKFEQNKIILRMMLNIANSHLSFSRNSFEIWWSKTAFISLMLIYEF